MNIVSGIHHVTAITGNLEQNFNFYTKILGLRFVKKTVNFDDPSAYHLYYGNQVGDPGTVLTFFYWPKLPIGVDGSSKISGINFIAPEGALEFWQKHLSEHGIASNSVDHFGSESLLFEDPEGLIVRLVFSGQKSETPWSNSPISAEHQIRKIEGIKLSVEELSEKTVNVLNYLGYTERLEGQDGVFRLNHKDKVGAIDISKIKSGAGQVGIGSIHHSAFRVSDKETQEKVRDKLIELGFQPTTFIDRFYFQSVYFMLPEGILFEIATDGPGFLIDEEESVLGQSLCLPAQFEEHREMIETSLEDFNTKL